MKKSVCLLCLLLVCGFTGCGELSGNSPLELPAGDAAEGNTASMELAAATRSGDYPHATSTTTVAEVINHTAFEGFGQYILPVKNRSGDDGTMPLSSIGSLLPYHGHIQTETTVEVINYMIGQVDAGETIFYDIYDQQQKQADPGKESTGLFFFPGEPGAPFAIISAGGGFSYVGSIHESFPHALELSKMGYNAFALEYRIAGQQAATEDLAAAITFVFEHAEELGVSTEGYSLWGGSAGARMAANIGSYGPASFGGGSLPRPGMVVIAYTGYSDYTENDPPTFTMVSENDSIASASVVERRVENMRRVGIPVEFQKYRTAGHGFGLGIGTDAEGWLEDAVTFWQAYLPLNRLDLLDDDRGGVD